MLSPSRTNLARWKPTPAQRLTLLNLADFTAYVGGGVMF